jgi:hypothetical protein
MNATTYYGEFKLSGAEEGSDLARSFARLMCQLNHPSMAGRPLDLSAYLKDFLGRESEPLTRRSW